MTNQERLVRSQAILRRQNSGKITKWEASAEMDELLDQSSGDYHFYSDTTCMKADWDGKKVMVFSQDPTTQIPSNTGIITQGPERGLVVQEPGATEINACMQHLDYFGRPGERRHKPE